ncbi:unnamed protein product [Rhizophagus irregularis]|nr:unnamed protein product [Rhizophagus irregularis]
MIPVQLFPLEVYLQTGGNQDVLIQAGKNSDYKELYAHSLILGCRSQYFRDAFSINSIEKIDGKYIIKRPDISPRSFSNILCYFYGGTVILDEEDGVEVLNLYMASNELELHKLKDHVGNFLKKHQRYFFQKHPIDMIDIIFTHDIFADLREFCLKTLCAEPHILLGTDKFKSLSEDVLIQLLKREDLFIREISIWDDILVWGFAKNPSLDNDVNKWSRDDIDLMKNTMEKFIPLIQFHDISGEDFFNKVLPYEDLIPKEIKQEALRAHMLPGTRSSMASVPNLTAQVNGPIRRATLPKIDSKIITTQHVLSFSSWIDGFEYKNAKIIPYDFNLLLRGSRDGMDPQTFHRLCDNKGPTLIVIKIRNSKRIVGGYNPLDWDSNGRSKTSPDGFIFSFDELETPNIGRVKPNECSVRCYKEWGASFGNYEGGNDLAMKNKAEWKSKPVSYPDIKIPKKFICSEYEVFQIKKKRNF